MWVILATIRVHFTGITLARTSLKIDRADARSRQWVALAVTFGAVAIVATTVARAFIAQPATSIEEVAQRLVHAARSGLSGVVLWPFMMLALPVFSPWPGRYLAALAGALVILLGNVVWVLRSDQTLQEAVAQAEAQRASKNARERPAPRARATRWKLASSGRPEAIFMWKNAMQTLRETTLGSLLRYVAPIVGASLMLSSTYVDRAGIRTAAALLGTLAAAAAAIAVVLGPQIARTDLRQDLLHLELLKTWPLRSAVLIRGEMLWPGALLTGIAWLSILCAFILWTPAFPLALLRWRVSVAVAAAITAPALVFAQLTIHNAGAVLFPAWMSLGRWRPRGL